MKTRGGFAITLTLAVGCFFVPVLVGCSDSTEPLTPVAPTTAPSPTSPPSGIVTPSISSISPTSAMTGSSDLTMRLIGTNFIQPQGPVGSWVIWTRSDPHGGTALRTTFVSPTELTAVLPAALLNQPGAARVFVENGDIMGISDGFHGYPMSNAVDFNVVPPASDAVLGVYRATFVASRSCAAKLPEAARERSYTATLLSDGRIEWTGPTLNPPPGHRPISSRTLSGDVFSFSIDIERDPQSDDFHCLWDDMGGGTYLNISGNGRGTVDDGGIAGLLNGRFAFYEPVPDPNVLVIGHYCRAVDHRFRFVKER